MRRALLLLASVTALGMPAVAVYAQATPIAVRSASESYAGLIAEAAQRFAIPEAWIRAIMRIESRGDRRAVSPKGAMGLMQLMPETWAALRPRARRVRCARQHLGGRRFPAGNARPLRIAGIPRGV
jgi:soluble lytic murein transglycosylase-like protein